MGINSYGLFGNGQPGGSYNRNYELQRQLDTRKQQLSDLDRMPVLSAAQQEKRKQLLNAVDHLSGKLSTDNTKFRRDTEDGIVIAKNKMDASKAYSQMQPRKKNGYGENEYSNSDRMTYKNPQRYDGAATTPGDTYLKGFFVDIKL